MTLLFAGYFPKRIVRRDPWLAAPHVDEIWSVSECMSNGPRGWIDRWRHNDFWLFDSVGLAESVHCARSRPYPEASCQISTRPPSARRLIESATLASFSRVASNQSSSPSLTGKAASPQGAIRTSAEAPAPTIRLPATTCFSKRENEPGVLNCIRQDFGLHSL